MTEPDPHRPTRSPERRRAARRPPGARRGGRGIDRGDLFIWGGWTLWVITVLVWSWTS